MIRSILQRLTLLVVLLLAVSMLTFGGMNVLGDPLFNILGPVAGCDDIGESDVAPSGTVPSGNVPSEPAPGGTAGEQLEGADGAPLTCGPDQMQAIADAKAQYYLDKPLPERYVRWLGDALQGDFGTSFANQGESVSAIVADRLPLSVALMVMAQLLALAIAVPWAVISAARSGGAIDRAGTIVSFGLVSLPNFALGIILYYVFVVRLQWFPYRYSDESLSMQFNSMVLPAITLALPVAAIYQRLLRSDLVSTLQEDFISMAKSKGLKPRAIMYRHALRPSLFSLMTVFGINTGALIGGTLVVEQIFSIPGAGTEIVTAVFREDFPVVLAFVVVITAGFVVMNILVDVLYPIVDPRVRDEQ